MDYDDDDMDDYQPDWLDEPPVDPVAARAEAFWKGVALLVHIDDAELRREGMMMLGGVSLGRGFRVGGSALCRGVCGGSA